MPSNRGAYQPVKQAPNLEVSKSPYPEPTSGQLVVRNAAVAVNPIDRLIQERGNLMFTYLKYPFILGYDVAGEVVEVGKGVTRFHVGDRVLGLCRGADENVNDSAEGAFQNYTVLREDFACPLPAGTTYEKAVVLPLGLVTASAALFDKAQLGLELPTQPARSDKRKTVIVWGGSTSVGCNAVQLAVAAGYEVFSTASPKNFDLVRKLGAARVWDYRSPTVVDDMVAAMEGKTTAGAVSIGGGAAEKCMDILTKCHGNKFVAMATFPVPEGDLKYLVLLRTVSYFISWLIRYKVRGTINGVRSALVAIPPVYQNGIGKHVFVEYLPRALEDGSFVPAPEPQVVGHGLESIQKAFAAQKLGVSAKKIVVTL